MQGLAGARVCARIDGSHIHWHTWIACTLWMCCGVRQKGHTGEQNIHTLPNTNWHDPRTHTPNQTDMSAVQIDYTWSPVADIRQQPLPQISCCCSCPSARASHTARIQIRYPSLLASLLAAPCLCIPVLYRIHSPAWASPCEHGYIATGCPLPLHSAAPY